MRNLLVFLFLVVAFVALPVFAQDFSGSLSKSYCDSVYPGDGGALTTTQISFRVVSSNGPSTNVKMTFDIPAEAVPANLSPYKIWDSEARTLTLLLGSFDASETKQLLLDFEGASIACTVYGILEGDWTPSPSVGPSHWQEEVNFSLVIIESSGGFSGPVDIIDILEEKVPIGVPLTTGALGAIAVVATVPWWELLQLFNIALLSGLRKKEQKPWGIVLDKATRRPVSGAAVKIYESESRKLKDTQITDVEGRFGFLVGSGLYYLHVNQGGYQEYETEFIKAPEKEEESLNLKIDLEETEHRGVFFKTLGGWLREIFAVGSPWILVLGTIFSLIVAVLFPGTLHYVILGLYILLDILKIALDNLTVKPFGTVFNKKDKLPLALAVVKVFDARHNWLMQTKVTNPRGRYKLLILPGEYLITCAKPGYKVYTSELMTVRRADLIKLDISLEPDELSAT